MKRSSSKRHASKKQTSKRKSLKSTIHAAVIKIKKQFPNINKSLIEMYVSNLIATISDVDENQHIDMNMLSYNIKKHVDNELYSIGDLIYEYANELKTEVDYCPCNNRLVF